MKLWETLREKMLLHPEKTVKEKNASVTYEELVVMAEHYASKFPKTPCIGIFCESEMAAAIGILACFAAGITAIPLPRKYGKELCLKMIERAGISLLFTDRAAPDRLIELRTQENKEIPENVAVILFTSGSAGVPKGVMLTDENLLANIKSISSYFPICKYDKVLIARTLYHSSSLTSDLLVSLWNGADIVFTSGPYQPMEILKLFRDEQITVFGSTPTLLFGLVPFSNRFPNRIRLFSISGECMTEGMAKAIRAAFPMAKVFCGYGLTEASPRVAYLPAERFADQPTVAGIPVSGVQCRIIGGNGHEERTPNTVGELAVRGENVMLGYFSDPEQTAKTLKNGWLYTGDLAKIDEDGFLSVIGRKDDLIIRAGMNIYPAEIENTLSSDARVREVMAYGYSDGNTQQIGLRICGDFRSLAEVAELCKQTLAPYQQPSKIELADRLERGVTGKKRRISHESYGI